MDGIWGKYGISFTSIKPYLVLTVITTFEKTVSLMAFTVYLISFISFSYNYASFVLTYGPNCPNRSRNLKKNSNQCASRHFYRYVHRHGRRQNLNDLLNSNNSSWCTSRGVCKHNSDTEEPSRIFENVLECFDLF